MNTLYRVLLSLSQKTAVLCEWETKPVRGKKEKPLFLMTVLNMKLGITAMKNVWCCFLIYGAQNLLKTKGV